MTTISSTLSAKGSEKSTFFRRSGVAVSPAMARSPRPSRRAGMRSSREVGRKTTWTFSVLSFRLALMWSSKERMVS